MSANSSRHDKRSPDLGEEGRRLARALKKISSRKSPNQPLNSETLDRSRLLANTIRLMIAARRARGKYLPNDLFADPVWDMLLELLEAEILPRQVSISFLCRAAAVPETTALRWLKKMEERGLVVRRSDPHDLRRVFIELAPGTSQALRRYFAEQMTPLS